MKKSTAAHLDTLYGSCVHSRYMSLSECVYDSEMYQALRYGTTEGYGFNHIDKRGAIVLSILSMAVLFGAAFIA